MMPLIDAIEALGARVTAGELSREEAARQLIEAGGGYTLRGALDVIDNWKDVRLGLTLAISDRDGAA
jgi:hypothetical protein